MRFPTGYLSCCSSRGSLRYEARLLIHPLFKAGRLDFNKAQRTLLTTAVASNPSYNPDPSCLALRSATVASRPRLRSPHNWAHIAHRIRLPPSAMATQTRSHAGHSHGGHHHHHDNTYLTSANKSDPGVRITRVGLYVNLGMAIAKGTGGYVFNSQAYALL